MLLGIGFLTVITAAITSIRVAPTADAIRLEMPAAEQLRRVNERLERIEAALTR